MNWGRSSHVSLRLVALLVMVALLVAPLTNGSTARAQLDDEATFTDLWTRATTLDPIFGPQDGDLAANSAASVSSPIALAHVSVQDFAVHAEFDPPTDEGAIWSVGIHFRLGQEPHFRFYISSSNRWWLLNGAGREIISGELDKAHADPEGTPTIDLVAVGNTGYVAVNGVFLSKLDLSDLVATGDISVAATSTATSTATLYRAFTIWSLDEAAAGTPTTGTGPTSADEAIFRTLLSLAQREEPDAAPTDGELAFDPAVVATVSGLDNVQNFVVQIAFESPYDPEPTGWDAGFFLRFGQEPHVRFVVDSSGDWYLALDDADPIQQGSIPDFQATEGGITTIDIVAIDAVGYAAINGTFIGTLDLSGSVGPGSVEFGTSFSEQNYVEGESIPYHDFKVWSLDD